MISKKFRTATIALIASLWLSSSLVYIASAAEEIARPNIPTASATASGLFLKELIVEEKPESTNIIIKANESITSYQSDKVTGSKTAPDRMYIDIKNVSSKALAKEKVIDNIVLQKIRVAKKGNGVRIVFDSALPKLFKYEIIPVAEGLMVVVAKPDSAIPVGFGDKAPESTANKIDTLLDSSSAALANGGMPTSSESIGYTEEVEEKYDFSGYKNKKISFDFYKIDVHNIFRLLREITGLNIVVDQAVKGTLTLALDDVPWDFALDIILNLTDLAKEERYNTLIIYPKKKKFEWPERAADNLDVSIDMDIIAGEAISVQKVASQPKEIIQAKSLMRKALKEEKLNHPEAATALYDQALALWPKNNKIANKLANLNLVALGANAKAVNYAKMSLKMNPQDAKAALYAGIGLANMEQITEAMEYFNQAVSGTPPMKEALVSYAAFSENNDQPEIALKLLTTYTSHYGNTVDTMLAEARIYDKIGQPDKAADKYKAILNSGFQLRQDLKKYIRGRIAAKGMLTN